MMRTKRPAARRQELIDAAMRVFVERGIDEATVEEVTDAAGAAKGTFYLYFRSKDDLVLAVRKHYAEAMVAAAEAALPPDADRLTQLRVMLVAMMTFYRQHNELHGVLYPVPYADGRPVCPIVIRLERLVEEGVAAGEFSVVDPWLTATFIHSASYAMRRNYVAGGRQDWERHLDALLELATRAVTAGTPAAVWADDLATVGATPGS